MPVQGGLEEYGGKNMDVLQVLLDFMEKRIDKVLKWKSFGNELISVLFLPCGVEHGACIFLSSQGSNYKEGLTPVLSLMTESSRYHREIRRYFKAKVYTQSVHLCKTMLCIK